MLEFETKSGNRYLYCTELNLVFPEIDSTARQIIETIDHRGISRETITYLFSTFENHPFLTVINDIYNFQEFYDVLWKKKTLNVPTKSEIKDHLYRYGFQEMILEVTQTCNMRCKYCIYSEMYELSRNSSSKKMKWDIAKAAIDLYFNYLKEGESYNPKRRATIGFYGGEPLLNFPLIKKCVEYTKAYNHFNSFFTITTNGTVFTDKIIDFLIENNINIIVSIDGSKEEHDRKRVLADGCGSFDIVMKNVKKIMDRNYQVLAIMVYDWKTDFLKEQKFFDRKDVPQIIFVNPVSFVPGCKYYTQFSAEDIKKFKEMLRNTHEYWFKELRNSEKKEKASVVETYMLMRIMKMPNNTIVPNKPPSIHYTGSCVPGTKMFVDCEGAIHTCERINPHFSIGHISTGLDFNKIQKIITGYHENILKTCEKCVIKHICEQCYAIFGRKGILELDPAICKGHIESKIESLTLAYSSMEVNPDIEVMMKKMFKDIAENRVFKEMI